ncbi:MAG: sugar transferase [Minwuia sp.]|nr:sugar transferase [Minwuia sp.]
MKRLFDILVALLLLLVSLPLFLPLAIAVRLDSPGSVFYRQIRVGQGGRTFGMLKFRSMVANADRIGGHSTVAGDARVTRVGRFIRKTSLDELPQLLNVLSGDMSLVGPRPDVPAQQAEYAPQDWALRHQARPGITGLAQALKRSAASPSERTEMDLRYVREQSFWLDLKILWWTVLQVIGKGSY